jgi:UDP-2,3-diacylglucosamine hydrolase
MKRNRNDDELRALFVADSHFHVRRGPAEALRFQSFLALLDAHAGVEHIVLLGDIFDFWFDYPHFVMKEYEPLLVALERAREAGSRLHFIGGNHDIWAARYLHERLGSAPAGGPVTLDLDGCRVHCLHGDGLLARDLLYTAFRSIVRHPIGVGIAKALHPEVLFALSTWLSGNSRHCDRDEVREIERKAQRWLARQDRAPWDHLIIGHVHHPATFTSGRRRLSSLGGWLDDLNYGCWRAGGFEHRQWTEPSREPGAS